MKTLSQLFVGLPIVFKIGEMDKNITKIHFDSREIVEGSAFIAIKGTITDGHNYIKNAIKNGATAIISEIIPKNKIENITYVEVENSRTALAKMAANYYDNPSHKLRLIGVTGTNGKTTIATLLHTLFQNLGLKSGLISTVSNFIDTEKHPTNLTTPDILSINKLLNKMVQKGCEYCFIEVSSHAIIQQRIQYLIFRGGIFTNITHDHLDYHKTFKDYLYTKKKFFDDLTEESFALSNTDDKNGRFILQNTKAKKYYYSILSLKDFNARILEKHFDGTLIEIDKTELWTRFIGGFNISNLLAVYATSVLMGLDKNSVLHELSDLHPVRGRFETIISNNGVKAIIDYAHSPDALKNVLQSIQCLCSNGDKIITVVGAGGDRDKAKRPKMGKIVATYSHRILLTSDNPRTENPENIIMEIKSGIDEADLNKVISIVDREEAIRIACALAKRGDVILVAGKGHETYQEIKGEKIHFDDREKILENFKT